MDYFYAVQEGRLRVKKALDLLQEVAGPSYAVLFLKPGLTDWTPVGEEVLYAVVSGKNSTAAIVLCDSEGNAKAMSSWFPPDKAAEVSSQLKTQGIERFEGQVQLPI